jgi:hypothetical protein
MGQPIPGLDFNMASTGKEFEVTPVPATPLSLDSSMNNNHLRDEIVACPIASQPQTATRVYVGSPKTRERNSAAQRKKRARTQQHITDLEDALARKNDGTEMLQANPSQYLGDDLLARCDWKRNAINANIDERKKAYEKALEDERLRRYEEVEAEYIQLSKEVEEVRREGKRLEALNNELCQREEVVMTREAETDREGKAVAVLKAELCQKEGAFCQREEALSQREKAIISREGEICRVVAELKAGLHQEKAALATCEVRLREEEQARKADSRRVQEILDHASSILEMVVWGAEERAMNEGVVL